MLRCTNPECRASLEFNIQALGDRYKRTGIKMEKVKAGKRTKPIEEIRSFQCKCMTCGHKDLVWKMQDAHADPMKYFDTNNLCDCGGEIWQDFEVKKPQETQEEDSYVGDQRKVSMQVSTCRRCEKCNKEYAL